MHTVTRYSQLTTHSLASWSLPVARGSSRCGPCPTFSHHSFTTMTALHVASGCANSLGAASSGARHSFPQRLSSHNSSCLRHLSPPEPTFLQILLCAGAVDEAFALADDAASCLPAGGVVPWLDTLLAEARTLASSSIFFSMIAGSGNARMVPPHCLIGRVRLHGRA